MPTRGAVVQVLSSAVNASGIADTTSDKSGGGPGRVNFTVASSTTAPTVFTSSARIAPGGTTTVTGGGYQPGESVGLTLPTQPVSTLATVTASSTGTLPPTVVTLASTMPFGPISLIATGATSGLTSSAPIYVSNNWDQWRNGPTRTGFEVNDSSLNNNVGANGRTYLDQAWVFNTGAPIKSSVAVDGGVAFFGNDAGNFCAITVVTGAPAWTVNFPSGIDSTAAVDSGLVIFGTEGGSVVALNESTGAQVWTLSTTAGVESSPAVYGGVVYVGADDGKVYAINEATGVVIWTQTLGGPVHSSPVVAANRGLVVVGDDSGNITALQMSNGAPKWHVLTGGAVTATPLYFSNNVYVGSADGKMYALVSGTGAPLWTYATGGPITASAVTFGTSIGIGSADGTVYYLDSKTGAVNNSLVGTQPIVGLSGAVNFMVAETAAGTGVASRVTGTDQTWKWSCPNTGAPCGLASSPTIVNGVVYITTLAGQLFTFTAPGRPVQ
jgi:outer membrane protein assembly factor BamB